MKFYKEPKGFEKTEEVGFDGIEEGAVVYMNPYYVGEDESPKKYFVMECSKGFALIADNKKMYERGEGYIYSIYDIDYYKNVC